MSKGPKVYIWFLGLLVFWSPRFRHLQTNRPRVQQSTHGVLDSKLAAALANSATGWEVVLRLLRRM